VVDPGVAIQGKTYADVAGPIGSEDGIDLNFRCDNVDAMASVIEVTR